MTSFTWKFEEKERKNVSKRWAIEKKLVLEVSYLEAHDMDPVDS